MQTEQKEEKNRKINDEHQKEIFFEDDAAASEPLKIRPDESKPRKKSGLIIKFSIFITIFALIGLTLFSNAGTKKTGEKNGSDWFSNFSIVGQLKQLAESSDRKLKGEDSDRINILLLGIGGKNHSGGYLTDTIMLVSIQPSTKKIAMISIPRDLTVPIENMGWRKINSISAYAEKENPGSGGLAASQAISQLFNVPIDYYMRVDFEAFTKIIDDLGGVDVNVPNTLDDYKYPILGKEDSPDFYGRWEHLHVDPGMQHMDGSLALKYARSRHGYGTEGSDFARAKRQQLIIQAVKDKLFSVKTLFKPSLITKMIDNYQEHVSTNLQIWEMVKLWEISKDVKNDEIINKVLDNSPSGLLVDQKGADGAYILVPRSNDFSQIQYLISSVFTSATAETKNKLSGEQAKIEVRNGTWINGLAGKISTDLEAQGFTVTGIGNASMRNYQLSVIYDLSGNTKNSSLDLLKSQTGANIASDLPQWLSDDLAKEKLKADYQQPDFILILGTAADVTASGVKNNAE